MAYKDKQQLYSYNNNFQREKYDVLRVLVPKADGITQEIRDRARAAGQSVSAYILQAVRDRMAKEQ